MSASEHPGGHDAAAAVVEDALRLPEADRMRVAAELLGSLDGPPNVLDDDAWLEEIKRRADRVRRGESQGEPWPAVRDALLAELRK
jgi:putative addiction module component (TIGR02574 family)